jgi:hypothetical protein
MNLPPKGSDAWYRAIAPRINHAVYAAKKANLMCWNDLHAAKRESSALYNKHVRFSKRRRRGPFQLFGIFAGLLIGIAATFAVAKGIDKTLNRLTND